MWFQALEFSVSLTLVKYFVSFGRTEKGERRGYSQYAVHNSARVFSLAPVERNIPENSVFSPDARTDSA